MKSPFHAADRLAAIFIMLALTGCAIGQHGGSASSQPTAAMRGGPAGEQRGMMDMKAMCDMHHRMMAAKSPEERRAMMDEHMKNMSPEMRQKHMQMMQEQCKQ
jgi:hypothetical protein